MHLRVTLLLLLAASPLCPAATRYDGDGEIPGRLEYQRWMINRARFAPEREADRYGLINTNAGGSPLYDVCEDTNGVNDFGTTTNAWIPWLRSLPPLAPNARMNTAAFKHAKDMAETQSFQHESPSSTYYPTGSLPVTRQLLEGYTNQVSGFYENIANGWSGSSGGYPAYGRSPTNVHDGLFIDTSAANRGHRMAILNNNAREMGLGTYRTNRFVSPFFRTYDYDVQDFGRTSTNHFFTDTIFNDGNTNGWYDEGEGVAGIEVHLWAGGVESLWYDVSGSGGAFAIPIHDIADGSTVEVELRNTNASSRTLTFPLGYLDVGDVTIPATNSAWLFSFVQPNGITNVGFRQGSPSVEPVGMSAGALTISGLRRATYRVESLTNLVGGAWTPVTNLVATSQWHTVSLPPSDGFRVYRVVLEKD